MEVTLSGIVMFVNALQPEKALLPILVTLSGILMEARSLQSKKVLGPMEVHVLGIVTCPAPSGLILQGLVQAVMFAPAT